MRTRRALRGVITLAALCFGLALSAAAGAAPTLVSPTPGSNVSGTSIAFTWNTVAQGATYIIGVWPNPDKTNGRLFAGNEANGPTTTKIIDGFPNDGTVFYWQVTAGNTNSALSYFANGATTPPDVPTVTGPADGAVIAGSTVTFIWNPAARAVDYRLQIAFDPGFTQLAFDAWAGQPSTTWNVTGFPNDASRWYWRVAAGNPIGSSAFTAGRSFVNGVPPSAAPTPTGPANGSNVAGATIPFRWTAVSGADNYRLVLATDSGFSNVVFDQWIGNFIGTDMSPFDDNGQQYFWKVEAGNAAGAGPFSATQSVVNGPSAPPAVPTLGAPADGANVGGTVITFSWNAAAHALDYRFTLATDSAFTNIVLDEHTGNANSVDVQNFSDTGKQFFWRVTAINPLGSSAPSAVRGFVNGPSAVPAAPTLVSPANGANAGGTTIPFRWNAAARANDYRLTVARDSGFTSLAFDDWVGNVTGFDFTAFDDGQQYFWRVTARNVLGVGPASAVSTVVNGPSAPPAAAPTLVSPADAANAGGAAITFSWNAVARASNYRLTIAFDAAFTQIGFDSFVGNVLSFSPSGFPDDGTHYFWRVTAANALGSSAPSAARSLVNGPSAVPDAPTLVSPASGANVAGTTITFQWNAVPRATGYRITLAFDSAFTQIALDEAIGNFQAVNVGVPDDGTQFFWRVTASNSLGDGAPSAASIVVNGPSAPPNPTTLVSPADGANVAGTPVPFSWNLAPRASNYRITIALDSAFTQIVLDGLVGDVTAANLPFADDGTRYFWRVTPRNSLGESAPSVARSFVNGPSAPPDVPALVSPAAGANVGGTEITFQWSPVPRAASYRFTLAFDSAFTQIAIDAPLGDFQAVTVPGFPDDGTQYFWRVSASNSLGESAPSAARSVMNGPSALPDAPALVSPAAGANVGGTAITFQWNPVPRATGYRLTMAFDSGFTQIALDAPLGNFQAVTVPGLPDDGTQYFWRVTASNSLGDGAPSAARSVVNGPSAPPDVPALISPATGANIGGTVIPFRWDFAPRANNYRLTIAFDNAFTQIAFDASLGNFNGADLPGFPDDGTQYFWRVSASNALGESAASAARGLVNGPSAVPGPVTLTVPAEGQIVGGTLVFFQWSPADRANNYRFTLAYDSQFTVLAVDASVGNTTAVNVPGLPDDGTRFFWRVTPANALGSGPASATGSFVNGLNPTACSPAVGTGIGLLVPRPHIDTCLDGASSLYFLRDVSRQASQPPNGHNGQMAANASIDTHLQDSGLVQDPDDTWDASVQAAPIDAHVGAAQVYDYHLGHLGLNGFDNAGSSMHSIIDSTDPSSCPNNAFWDGVKINFCANVGILSFAAALDVVGHEWGHAVTQYASGLVHAMESGALNESFSDWIGTATEQANGGTNWTIGESVELVRDMANPPALQQPDTYGGTFWFDATTCTPAPENDFCGVHQNTGVPNKMFYLLSVGGTHNGVLVQGIGIDKAMRIGFEANRNDWVPDTTLAQARDGMVAAAQRIFGQFSNEQTQVRNAWAAVMVGSVPPTATTGPAQTVTNGSAVTLTGTGADQDGTVVSYRWLQTAGPTVTLTNATTNRATFTAPTVRQDTVLTFRLVVTDNAGEVGSQTISVTVTAKKKGPGR